MSFVMKHSYFPNSIMTNEKTEIQRQGGSMSHTQNRNEPQEQERCIESSKSTNQIISISSNEMPSSKQDKLYNPNEGNVALVKKIVCNFIRKHHNITLLRGAFCAWKSVADFALAKKKMHKSECKRDKITLRRGAFCAWKVVADFALAKKMTHAKLIKQSCKRHNITLLRGAFRAWKMAVQVAPYKSMIVNVINRCCERHNMTLLRGAFRAWKMAVQVAIAKKMQCEDHNITLLPGAFRAWKMAVQVASYKSMIVNVIDRCCERHNITLLRGAFCAWKMAVQVAIAKKMQCEDHNITLLPGAFRAWKMAVQVASYKSMIVNVIDRCCERHNITLLRGAFCAWKMAVQVAPYKIMIVNVIDKCYERHNITLHRNAFFAWKMTVQVALAKKNVCKLIQKIHKIALLRGAFRLWNTFKKKLVSTFECGFQVIKNAVSVDFMCKILHGIHACPLNYVFRVWNMFKVDVLAKKRLIRSMQYRIQRKRYLVAFRLWENFGKYMLAMQRLLNVRKDPKNLTLMRHFFGEWVLLPKKKMLEVRTFLEDIESEDYIDQIIKRLTERGLFLPNQESVESFDPENFISESDEESSDSDTEKLVSI